MRRMRYLTPVLTISLAALGASAHAAAPSAGERSVEIVADQMCCAGCARKVTGQLYTAKGVRSVEADVESRTLKVSLTARGASLGELWAAVERGDGGPTRLQTAEATFTLTRPRDAKPNGASPVSIVVETMHCKSCAQQIAAQLYALKGVTKVSVNLAKRTLYVASAAPLSPWAGVEAVMRAGERPLAVAGPHGRLVVEWKTEKAPSEHRHAQTPQRGGIR